MHATAGCILRLLLCDQREIAEEVDLRGIGTQATLFKWQCGHGPLPRSGAEFALNRRRSRFSGMLAVVANKSSGFRLAPE
jgi:hypothetical protein